MARQRKHIIQDVFIIAVSILVAVFALKNGFIDSIVASLGGFKYLGMFIAGMFFTSVFTTAPSMVMIGELAQNNQLMMVSFLGGLGSVVGDYIIFCFARDRISEDLEYLLRFSKTERFSAIFETKLFHRFVPFLGAVILVSPLPDEIGVSMLGVSKLSSRYFLLISFVLHGLGIFIIGRLAQLAM